MNLSEDDLAARLGTWRHGAGTLAERLGRRLVALVDEGVLPDAARLPTERALAERLGVARTTATAAYRHAKDAGRIASRQGSGSWVRRPSGVRGRPEPAGRAADAFAMLGRPAGTTVDLTLAETPCDGPTRQLLGSLDAGWLVETAHGTGYHPQGLPVLRERLAEHLNARAYGAGGDQVLVTTGAQQAIALTVAATCPPGSTALVEEASYPGALDALRRAGVRTLPIPCDDRGPDPDALAHLLATARPALVYLVPVANNPTGVVVPAARLDALAEVLAPTGTTVLEDRTAAPLADPATVPAPLATRLPAGSVVVVGSTSKIAWAGLRTGWAVAPARVLPGLLAARIAADLAGSLVSQAVLARIVDDLPALAATVRADVAVRQATLGDALAEHLPEWDAGAPGAGAWRWVRLPGHLDARALARAAAAEGVTISPGHLFSPLAALTDRVRLAAVADPEVLVEGVVRLQRARNRVGATPQTPNGRDLLLI